MTTSETPNPLTTPTTIEPETPQKPKRKSSPRKKKEPIVEPKKFDISQFKGAAVIALLVAGLGLAKYGKWGDNTVPTPTPAVEELSETAKKVKEITVKYNNDLADNWKEIRQEIKEGKHPTVTSWATSLYSKTETSKKNLQESLNGMLKPVAGGSETTPATEAFLGEMEKGFRSVK